MATLLSAGGASESWLASKAAVVKMYNDEFRAWKPVDETEAAAMLVLAVKTWDNLIEAEATNPELYTYFATFLVMGYTGPKNKPLAHGTVKGYLGSLMNMAKAKFGATGTDATKLFFTALDKGATTESHAWYKKLKDRIWRICFQRAKEAGEKMDSSADPLYAKDFAEMVQSLALDGSPEAAVRAFSLLCLFQSAGRSAEPAYMAMGSMNFDGLYRQVSAEVPQSKTSKLKVIAFVAGFIRYLCWFLLWGDYLMLDPQRKEYTEEDDPAWLLNHLQEHGSPGTRLGDYIKALAWCLTSKPAKPTAAGARVGGINTLLPHMPPFFVCQATGQNQREESSCFEYFMASIALQQPAATLLGGWNSRGSGGCS